QLNDAGQALGTSDRFSATGADLGESLWFYNPANNTTAKIGLTDAEHTAKDGTKNSSGTIINTQGMVVGQSDRFNQTISNLEQSTWFNPPATNVTTKIGLFDSEYTSSLNEQSNQFYDFDAGGDIVGSAVRYNGGTITLGQSIWYFNPATGSSSKIGFTATSE